MQKTSGKLYKGCSKPHTFNNKVYENHASIKSNCGMVQSDFSDEDYLSPQDDLVRKGGAKKEVLGRTILNSNAYENTVYENGSNIKYNGGTKQSIVSDTDNLPLQNNTALPILFGGDVKTLYPSLDPVTTSKVAADAIRAPKFALEELTTADYWCILH